MFAVPAGIMKCNSFSNDRRFKLFLNLCANKNIKGSKRRSEQFEGLQVICYEKFFQFSPTIFVQLITTYNANYDIQNGGLCSINLDE